MNPGGDIAETVVRLYLHGAEIAIKLTGAGAKNLAALLYALLKDNAKRSKGRTRLLKLLKNTTELKSFDVKVQDLPAFHKLAKKLHFLYVPIGEKGAENGWAKILVRVEDLARANIARAQLGYDGPVTDAPKISITKNARARRSKRSSPTRERSSMLSRLLQPLKRLFRTTRNKYPPVWTPPPLTPLMRSDHERSGARGDDRTTPILLVAAETVSRVLLPAPKESVKAKLLAFEKRLALPAPKSLAIPLPTRDYTVR